jgi:hypothetical protein
MSQILTKICYKLLYQNAEFIVVLGKVLRHIFTVNVTQIRWGFIEFKMSNIAIIVSFPVLNFLSNYNKFWNPNKAKKYYYL